ICEEYWMKRVHLSRREMLAATAAVAWAGTRSSVPAQGAGRQPAYPYLGRTEDYAEFQIIKPGLVIETIESWTKGSYGFVRVTTRDGKQGVGQISTSEPDISATVLHRQISQHVLGADPAQIDLLVDRVIDVNMKFPWSFVCRALAGVDTAIWDL